MTRILFVGQKPETVDFSDPSLPPGFDAEKINAGIAVAVAKIEELRGIGIMAGADGIAAHRFQYLQLPLYSSVIDCRT